MNYTEEKISKSSKYPTQCWVAQNATQTLTLENELRLPEPDGEFSPYTMHGTFSRFRLSMVLPQPNPTEKRRVITYNIRHTNEIAYIIDQYEEAKHWRRMYQSNAQDDTSSPAYTVVFGLGKNLKGKTAAEFLLQGGSPDELRASAAFLAKGLTKWPANQEYIDAIDDALYLHSSNMLTPPNSTPKSYVLLDEQNKISNGNKRGLKITCMFGFDYPWQIDVSNSKLDQDNKVIPNSVVTGTYALNDMQMSGFIASLKNTLLAHHITMYPAAKAMSQAIESTLYPNRPIDPTANMVNDLLECLKPALIESLKGIMETTKTK